MAKSRPDASRIQSKSTMCPRRRSQRPSNVLWPYKYAFSVLCGAQYCTSALTSAYPLAYATAQPPSRSLTPITRGTRSEAPGCCPIGRESVQPNSATSGHLYRTPTGVRRGERGSHSRTSGLSARAIRAWGRHACVHARRLAGQHWQHRRKAIFLVGLRRARHDLCGK